MAAKPHKSCRPRSTSRLGRAPTIETAFLRQASEPGPAGRRAAHLRSVAGEGHGAVLPVTLPRGASDQRKRTKAGTPRSPTLGGPIRGGIRGPLGGPIRGEVRVREIAAERSGEPSGISLRIARRRGSEGLNRPRRGRDPAPGRVRPMPSPGGNTTRPDKRRPQGRSSSAADAGQLGRPEGQLAACGRSTLTPGSGRMVPVTRVGRSALRAAAPPGEGAAAPANGRR
jgi:hypothetical protein